MRATLLLAVGLLGAAAASAHAETALLPDSTTRAWQTGLTRTDRLQHASLSLTLAFGIGVASDEPAAGVAAALGFGLAKELRDQRSGRFDVVDLAADAIGALLGGWAAASLTR